MVMLSRAEARLGTEGEVSPRSRARGSDRGGSSEDSQPTPRERARGLGWQVDPDGESVAGGSRARARRGGARAAWESTGPSGEDSAAANPRSAARRGALAEPASYLSSSFTSSASTETGKPGKIEDKDKKPKKEAPKKEKKPKKDKDKGKDKKKKKDKKGKKK